MEHSVQAYLERQSTQVLNKLLRELLGAKELDGDTIRLVLRILEKRDREGPREEAPEVERILEQFKVELLREERASAAKKT